MNFISDNTVGASASVLEAIVKAAHGQPGAYGSDDLTKQIKTHFAEIFEHDVQVFCVATGTAANALSLAAITPPWGISICHHNAHVMEDECGAPEFYMHGAKLNGLPGVGAKFTAATLEHFLQTLPHGVNQAPAKSVTISQATECGLIYTPQEIAAISKVCKAYDLPLHMDGARFVNALVELGCTPAELTWKAGVDILSFGATKNGCVMAEAIIVFNPALAETLAYRRKRAGQTLSKNWLIAAQFEAYFADDLWLKNALHANRSAKLLAQTLSGIEGVRIAWEVQANEVFAIVPRALHEILHKQVRYYDWPKLCLPEGVTVSADEIIIRFVTTFETQEASIHELADAITQIQAQLRIESPHRSSAGNIPR
ncbi:MAG: low specificity L-threonine aldolase, partial [Alphaproteobacteria bacterium]|nr:low specificity L-threonine aldolase [Alphaproteobacteria bacterium]